MTRFASLLLLPLALSPAILTGCATNGDLGPSLLVQKNVNGTYSLTDSGKSTDPVMLQVKLASGEPVAPSGDGYYSTVTGTLTNTANLDLGACNGQTIALAGRITNPTDSQLPISMTGKTAGGGSVAVNRVILINGAIDIGKAMQLTLQIDCGECPTTPKTYIAQR